MKVWSSIKCWISHNIYLNGDNKVRDNFCLTGKFTGFTRKDINMKIKS